MTFRDDIQGLRAFAVLAVLVFHYDATLLPGGFVGVDIFLVISGYLITNILLKQRASLNYDLKSTLWQFYKARSRRIVPAYYVMLTLVALASAVLFIEVDFSFFYTSLKHAALFISNQYFAGFGNYFAPRAYEQPLLHTWSLAVEMQFYLFYPLTVLLLPRRWLKLFLSLLMLVLVITTEFMLRVKGEGDVVYYAIYARIPEFLAGAAVSLYGLGDNIQTPRANRLWIVGFALLLASVVFINGMSVFPGILSLVPILGACLLLVSGRASSYRFLCSKPFVWIGTLSYSLYLWHWPVLALIRYYTGAAALDAISTILFIVATFILALSSYYWVEVKFNSNAKKSEFSKQKTHMVGVLSLIILVSGIIGIGQFSKQVNNYLVPSELPIEYRRYADPTKICHGKILDDCLQGDLLSNREVLVLGDSHAAMLNNFFDYLGNKLSIKARIITASSCVPIDNYDYQRLPNWAQKPCLSQIKQAKKYIANSDIIFIAAMWSGQTQTRAFNKALQEFLEEMTQQGKSVYLIPQVPLLDKSPLRAIRFSHLGIPIITTQNDSIEEAKALLHRMAQSYSNVTLLKLSNNNLFSRAPFYRGDLIYFDKSHINEIGSILYGQMVKDSFIEQTGLKQD